MEDLIVIKETTIFTEDSEGRINEVTVLKGDRITLKLSPADGKEYYQPVISICGSPREVLI